MTTSTTDIRPLPGNKGVGFVSTKPVEVSGYRYEPTGRYHNYFFTAQNCNWPVQYPQPNPIILDGFSPNLNKSLHVGHLRNLALAKSFSVLFQSHRGNRFVALFGTALGRDHVHESMTKEWLKFVGYFPEFYTDEEIANQYLSMPEAAVTLNTVGEGEYKGCMVYEGKKHPVVAIRSSGETTYDLHDLAFAQIVKPTHYLTGTEQREHFENLGLGDKHLAMGLILDPVTGKKMKSRDGNALDANSALEMVVERLNETEKADPRYLAWNILAFNFLQTGRESSLKFDVDKWVKPEQAGLYITYTYARLHSAIENVNQFIQALVPSHDELNEVDIKLLGMCQYANYWRFKAQQDFDPAPLANYTHDLCRLIGSLYHTERIADGRPGFQYAAKVACDTLNQLMYELSMFPLTGV